MKLPIKLNRSLSTSPPSSSPPSPAAAAAAAAASCSTSPTSPNSKKLRFSFPHLGRSSSKRLRSPCEISEVSSSCASPTSSYSPRSHPPNAKPKSSSTASDLSTSLSSRHGKGKMSQNAMHEIQQVFAQFDTDGDGRISAEELRAVLALLGDETTSEEAALMVREVDIDGDGYIDLDEFVQLNARWLHGTTEEEEMKAAFAIFDLDKNGRITAEELQAVLRRLGGSLAQRTSVEDCKRMIRGVDRKGVGHVDFDDFKRMMTHLTF